MKMKPRRPITRLWLCELRLEKTPVILVKKGPIKMGGRVRPARRYSRFRYIRACTAKAAGRRMRKNIASEAAFAHHELDNISNPTHHQLQPEMLDRFKNYSKTAKVVVIKE